jgi:hypothetical protein
MAASEITCPMCGFKNAADAARCRSCGAKVEAVSVSYTAEEEAARRYQQEAFEWRWVFTAFGVYVGLQTVILAVLPRVISTFDPQGMSGLLISVGVWFAGGIVVGLISPGKTFVEPAVGALLAALPTIAYLAMVTPAGFQPPMLAYIILSMLGVMLSLLGAFVGERVQMGARGTAKT